MPNKVNPVPEGFHTVSPYIMLRDVDGAIAFYKEAFGATVTARETDENGNIRNAEIKIGDSMLMFGQHAEIALPISEPLPPLSFYMYVEDADATHAKAVAAGAKEIFPVDERFYGNREGGIVDPFGITWWIATRVEELTREEIQNRATAAFASEQ
jgi:PhnB protein